MSAAPSEPEKYSIDEMMDRLKQSSSESPDNGELVTRADGSQAVRVRKRKRRSSQPKKESVESNRRARIIQISAALVLVIGALLAAGVGIIYANSSLFRDSLIQKIEHATGADAGIVEFRMNPKTGNAKTLSMTWPQGNVLKSMVLNGLTAEIFPSSFLGKSMNGEEVIIQGGTVALQYPEPGQTKLKNPPAGDSPAINFSRYRSRVLDITLGNTPGSALGLSKTEGSFAPNNVKGVPQLSLYKGELFIPNWPKLRLDRALVEFHGEEADIINLRLLHEKDNQGSFQLRGTVSPYQPEQLTTLEVGLESFQISGIIGPAFGKLVDGEIDTQPVANSNFLSFRPTATSSAKLDVAFSASLNSKISMQGFPFLSALSQALGEDEWFLNPVFEEKNSAGLLREAGAVSIRNIDFESKARMALRGEISLSSSQTLSGNLQVGISEAMIVGSKNSRLINMFGPTIEGFRWITLKIDGQVNAPTDNFKVLFDAAKASAAARPAGETGSSFEELTTPSK